MRVETASLQETQALAQRLGEVLQGGEVLLLSGDLGAGKTAFVQGLAKGMGIEGWVTSPTFTFVQELDGQIPLYHWDLYRLESWEGLADLGFEEYMDQGGVMAVEWPDRLGPVTPPEHLAIEIQKMDGDGRGIEFRAYGPWAQRALEALK